MADYSESKDALGGVYQINEVESVWQRLEPLINPEKLRSLHLFGLPLVSSVKNPITGKADMMSDAVLASYIEQAVNTAELETGLTIFPTQYTERQPFDRPSYEAFGYFMTKNRPVASIQKLSVVPASNIETYVVPLEWVETGNLQYGQINIIPLTLSILSNQVVPTYGAAGALFFSLFGNRNWIPAFWQIQYTAGFPEGKVPSVVNQLIGTIAAMEVLSMLATTFAKNSGASISLDGLSQSVSTPGPNVYKTRMDELADKRQRLVSKLKAEYGLKIFTSHI